MVRTDVARSFGSVESSAGTGKISSMHASRCVQKLL